jgi:misacylated tRNA(Ala) deacylase
MTLPLFREDPYLRHCEAVVIGHTPEGAIVVDRSVFYPTGGGQPGDAGYVEWIRGPSNAAQLEGGQPDRARIAIATAIKLQEGRIGLVPAEPAAMPPVGASITQVLDWDRRHRHMRIHTALHLLSVVIPLPVTGGQIGADRGRLDFDMPDPLGDVAALDEALNALIDRDLPVTERWITDAELLANPGLVKTLSVRPPMGQGDIRLIRIGRGAEQVDLQPCGGTHVARTGEIGRVEIGKIEKKGRQNRRVSLTLI